MQRGPVSPPKITFNPKAQPANLQDLLMLSIKKLHAPTIALAIIAATLSPAGQLKAQDLTTQSSPGAPLQQTAEQATALLTSGKWRFHGVDRTFKPDGTFTSKNGNVGTWKITEDQLEIDLGTLKFRFFLPLDPKGTRGQKEKHQGQDKGDTLTKVS
jgi:hypothetical protein